MTKLEEKLIELGYEYRDYIFLKERNYIKWIGKHNININVEIKNKKKIKSNYIVSSIILTQQDIDNLQQAFNELQKDLEELKKYEI